MTKEEKLAALRGKFRAGSTSTNEDEYRFGRISLSCQGRCSYRHKVERISYTKKCYVVEESQKGLEHISKKFSHSIKSHIILINGLLASEIFKCLYEIEDARNEELLDISKAMHEESKR